MPRVYLETSFISACVTTRDDPGSLYRRAVSRDWWQSQRQRHELVLSAEVLRELASPQYPHRAEALALASAARLVPIDDEVRGIAQAFVRERLIPGPEDVGDAVHLAAAVRHRVDFLLSWNVRHLANVNKVTHLRTICRRLGVVPPELVTPDGLWFPTEHDPDVESV